MKIHSSVPQNNKTLKYKEKRPNTSDDKRVRLLTAALDLFGARGFDGVAVPEIARAADVATGTIYRYFRDKEDLVNGLYRHWKAAYNAFVFAPVPDEGARQKFGFHWHRIMLFARANPHALRFLCLHHHRPYLDAESLALDEAEEEGLVALIPDGAKLAPRLAAALIWGAAAGMLKFAGAEAPAFDAAAAGEMEEALWRAIVG